MNKREVTYTLTKQEFIKLAFTQTARNRYGAFILLGYLLVVIIGIVVYLLLLPMLSVILEPIFLGIIFLPIFLYYRFSRHYHRESQNQGVTISIAPDGFGVSGEGLESKINWKYAKDCKESSKYISFRLQNSPSIFSIPKRCFPSQTEADAFFHDLQTYISKVR